ncbi:hypothetical protein [Nocardia bovistercoris]|uniref:Metal transporter n=1 Tax=Nocardia bovistercoris TaxID=2785916 RepID=A0A931IHM6_9NOCA|nr:hypothetical protein [Nocardia bovistercoris]MBH0781571.1 hypothetical protein [Nocardia bovistercoris]
MRPTVLATATGVTAMCGACAVHATPFGFGSAVVIAVLGLLGVRSAWTACAAVLTTAAALAVLRCDTSAALLAGLGATVYLVGSRTRWTEGQNRELSTGLIGAVGFGAAAATVAEMDASLPWVHAAVPVVAVIAAVVPLRLVRARSMPRLEARRGADTSQ